MNSYRFNDIRVGLRHEFQANITAEKMAQFREISGDTSPLHVDESFAKAHGFPSKVGYGLLTASFYSTLVGVYLPGQYAVLQECKIEFRKPVYAGDVLTVSGEVVHLSAAYKQIEIKSEIKNAAGEKVSNALIKVGLFE